VTNIIDDISHGDKIALQTFVRSYWIGCSVTYCSRAPCPRMHMSVSDWNNCWGEVFQIYRANGAGKVQVGDLVGLYYPREAGRWLGCAGSKCAKATCPGLPTTLHGFAASEDWYRCWGEVFKIYVKGKTSGPVKSDDDVALYYLQDSKWAAQGDSGDMVKYPCLGTARPPAVSTYDSCAFETFRIWKK